MSNPKVNFRRYTSMPSGTLPSDSLIYVKVPGSSVVEQYITDSLGNSFPLGNTQMINDIFDERLMDQNFVEFAGDFAAMYAMATPLTRNMLFLVLDATGDPSGSVMAGSAFYAYKYDEGVVFANRFAFISDFESQNLNLAWESISGRPNSSPAQIDQAVANSHTHANKVVLDKLSVDSDGDLTYDGQAYPYFAVAEW